MKLIRLSHTGGLALLDSQRTLALATTITHYARWITALEYTQDAAFHASSQLPLIVGSERVWHAKLAKRAPASRPRTSLQKLAVCKVYPHRSAHACLVPDHYLPVFLYQPRRWPTKRMPFRGRRLPTTSSSCTRNEHTTAAPTCIHASNRAKVTSFSTSHASLPASWTTHRHKNARNIPRN